MTVDDHWGTPSKSITTIMVTLAVTALGLTLWYLWPGLPFTLVGMATAATLLGVPLATRWPITPRRAGISAAVWFAVGLPGSYLFGTPVAVASMLLALSLGGTRHLLARAVRAPVRVVAAATQELLARRHSSLIGA